MEIGVSIIQQARKYKFQSAVPAGDIALEIGNSQMEIQCFLKFMRILYSEGQYITLGKHGERLEEIEVVRQTLGRQDGMIMNLCISGMGQHMPFIADNYAISGGGSGYYAKYSSYFFTMMNALKL